MNVLEQARLTVAERVIAMQQREIRSLQLRDEIARRRHTIATLSTSPWGPMVIMSIIYLLYCGIDLWLAQRKENK